ncbi:hypothetical protein FGB62_14g12 [Gracilaria domingensis]|nr:hypothetical protein FGB62_14g12 [Gracilaria domingensis]
MASHERVHSRRTDHPLTASAYARRAELQHASPARRRNQHSAAPPAANRATDAFVAQLELQQANQWQDAQRQQQQATAERLLPPPLRQQQTQRHLQEQQRISREERLQYYESEQRLMQLQEQFHLTDNQSLTQPPALRRNLHHDFDPNSDTHQGYAPPAQQYLHQQPHLRPAQPPKAPHAPHLPYHSTFQHEQTTYPASNAPKHRELSYPPPQDYAADPIIYPQPTCSQPLSEHPNSAIPSREYSDLVLQAEKLSLLGYFNTSATDREIASRRHLSTEMTPIEDSPTKPGTDAAPFQLAQDHPGDQAEIPKTENVVYCQDAHLKPSNNPVPEGRHSPSSKPSNDTLCTSEINPTDPANSNGSMDFFCRTPKFQNEEMEMIPYFSKEYGSHSAGDRPMSIESKIFGDASPDVGLSYFSREPSAPLDRLSGELKYNGNGKWSCNMSDILNVGVEPGRSGSLGHLSLILPELGNGLRGTYSNSVSPLGMTLTNPSASPRTSVAYIRRGFLSPHVSQSFSIVDK